MFFKELSGELGDIHSSRTHVIVGPILELDRYRHFWADMDRSKTGQVGKTT